MLNINDGNAMQKQFLYLEAYPNVTSNAYPSPKQGINLQTLLDFINIL